MIQNYEIKLTLNILRQPNSKKMRLWNEKSLSDNYLILFFNQLGSFVYWPNPFCINTRPLWK